MRNNKILAAALLAIFLTPIAASAATDLTVGEIQLLKNEAATLKNKKAVSDLKKKLEEDAAPAKAELDAKKLPTLPMPPAMPGMPPVGPGSLGMPVSVAPKMTDFCTGYNALLIRGSGSDEDKSALISGKDHSEIFVKKGTVLSDGCVIEKINDQSLVVRGPSKGKKSKGKLYTVLLGADQSNLIKPSAPALNNNFPTIPSLPMLNDLGQQGSASKPYAGY